MKLEIGRMQLWFRLASILHLLHFVISCPLVEEPFGAVTPDQDLEVGSLLKVRCSLFEDQARKNNISVKNLSIKFKRRVLTAIKTVDDFTIEYTVPNATVDDSGNYVCFVEHPDYDVKQLVCLTHVAVGYKPLNVEEFSCISLEYSNLTCKWKIPLNPVETKYTLYDYFYMPTVNRTCPEKLNSSSCQFRLNTNPPYLTRIEKLHFILVGTNSLGVNKQFIDVDHYKIVKPGVPKFIICSNITKNSLFLHWNAPKGLEYGEAPSGLLYQVKYYSLTANLHDVKEIVKFSEKDLLITIKDLVPNTLYEFKVRVRLNISGNDFYWSEVAKHTEKTESDVPYLAPEVTKSGFDVEIINGNRSITLYWKAVPPEHENGEDFHYIIRYHEHYVPFRFRREASKIHNSWVTLINTTSHTFEYMDLNSAYIFNIIAVNKAGNSSNESAIVVDKNEKLLQGPKDITVISYGNGNYSLSWKDPNEETTHYTVFWCQTLKSRPAKCDGPIEWVYTINTRQNLLVSNHRTNYQFAVAANHNHQTSGMVWAPCIALYNGVRYKVEDMKLMPKNSTSLKVQWSLGCKAQENVIHKYLIAYCPYEGKCGDPNWKCEMGWSNVTVLNSTRREYILGSLKPFTCYFSFIRVLTNSGWSEDSHYAYETTMTSAPSDSPRNVVAFPHRVTPYSIEIELSFEPPITPNGIITKYKVFYNQSLDDSSLLKEIWSKEEVAGHYQVKIKNSIHYNTNYSIQVAACVNEACSELSMPVYVYTGLSNPSIISAPRVEVSESFINITWEAPSLPNGPIDFYEVELCNNDTGDITRYTVNSTTMLSLERICDSKSVDFVYNFRVRAVNIDVDTVLYGEYSRPTKMVLCPSGDMLGVYLSVGIGVGAVLIIIVVCFGLYCGVHKCHKEYLLHKNVKIKLPLELETPFDNPLTSFDKLKNGLQISTPDSSIPSDRAYERLCSFAQEGNQINVAGWDATDVTSQRNNSGESNRSGLSSADTTRTLVSMDSSAEQAESESSDNSQEEEVEIPTNQMVPYTQREVPNVNSMVFSRCFMRPTPSNTPSARTENSNAMPAYCKFSEIPNMALVKKFDDNQVLANSQNQSGFSPEQFLENLFKINSEPSLYASDSEDMESRSPSRSQAYSKVGLARSSTNISERNVGYSRFGAILNTNGLQKNSQIFNVLMPHNPPLPFFSLTGIDKNAVNKKNSVAKDQNSSNECRDAYSKFGVGSPIHNSDHQNYVSINDFHEIPSQNCMSVMPFVLSNGKHNCSELFNSKGGNNSEPKLLAIEYPENNFPEIGSDDPDQTDDQLQVLPEDNDQRTLQEILAADERFIPTSEMSGSLPSTLKSCDEKILPISNDLVHNSTNNCSDMNGSAYLPNEESIVPNLEQDKNNFWEGSLSEEDFSDEQESANIVNAALNNYVPINQLAKHLISTKTFPLNSTQNCQN